MTSYLRKACLFLLALTTLMLILNGCGKTSVTSPHKITIITSHLSYFQLNNQGTIALKNDLPYPSATQEYSTKTTFTPDDTAFFVIDPWNNIPSTFLNEFYGNITKTFILPLVEIALKNDFDVTVFTNDCKLIKPKPYSCAISNDFYDLAKRFRNAHIVYWQQANISNYAEAFKKHGISKLIYMGYASNMCVIGRPLGMIPMKLKGFNLYYIPQASAAVETEKTWKSQTVHKTMTTVISQWLAELINYDDIYKALAGESDSKKIQQFISHDTSKPAAGDAAFHFSRAANIVR